MKRFSEILILIAAALSVGCCSHRNLVGKTIKKQWFREYRLHFLTDTTARYFEANSPWRDIDTVRWEYLDENTIRLWRDFTHLDLPLAVTETAGYSPDSLYFILPRENYFASMDSVCLYLNGKPYRINYELISEVSANGTYSCELPPCAIDYDERSATCRLRFAVSRHEIGELQEIYLTAAANPKRYFYYFSHRPFHDYIRSAPYSVKEPANNVYHVALDLPYKGTIKGGFFFRDWDRTFTLIGCRKKKFSTENTFFFDDTNIIYDWPDLPFGHYAGYWEGYRD